MSLEAQTLHAFGITIQAWFEDRAAQRLLRLVFPPEIAPDQSAEAVLCVRSRRTGSPPSRPTEAGGWTILGSDVAVAANRIWFRHGRHVTYAHFEYATTTLGIEAHFTPRADRRFRALLRPSGPTRWEDALHDLRGALYLPLFWLLAIRRGVVALHSAAVKWHGRALLIAGMNGAGKSTLVSRARSLAAPPLADNYALLDPSGTLLSFPELERRTDSSRNSARLFHAFGKSFFPSVALSHDPVPLGAVVVLARRSTFTIEPLSLDAGLEALSLVQRLTPEFVEDTPLRLLGATSTGQATSGRPYFEHGPPWRNLLASALSQTPIYLVSLPRHALDDLSCIRTVLDLANRSTS